MNILMLTNTYAPHVGGVARSVEAFAEEYRRRGHRVMIVAPTFEGATSSQNDLVRIPAVQHFNGSDFSVPVPLPVALTLATDDFPEQIVHSHHPFLLGDAALRVAALRDLPLVFTHHTLYEQYTHYVPGDSPAMKQFAIDLATGYCNLCDAVIAPSRGIKRLLRERGVETRIEVIPTGVDFGRFQSGQREEFRRRHGIPADAFVVGHLGRLAPEKNLDFLAQAVAGFLAENRAARFLLVGQGPSLPVVQAALEARGVAQRVVHPGQLTGQDLIDAYHAMDVFAFASHSETQGMVLTEAMAAQVPVVAVSATGVDDVLDDGVNGRLLPTDDAAQFAAALGEMATLDAARRQSFRAAALRTAEQFSLPACADRALELYGDLCGRAPRARDIDNSLWTTAWRLIEREWEIASSRARAVGDAIARAVDDAVADVLPGGDDES